MLFVPAIANLKAASALAADDDFAVLRAQFDLSNMTASRVRLLGDQGRALWASSRLAARHVPARMNANRRRSGVEVRLKHETAARRSSVLFGVTCAPRSTRDQKPWAGLERQLVPECRSCRCQAFPE